MDYRIIRRGRPRFLSRIQHDLDCKLKDIQNNPSKGRFEREALRLRAFSGALADLSHESKTFGTILARIQAEYENHINEIRRDLVYFRKEKERVTKELAELQKNVLEQVDLSDPNKDSVHDKSGVGVKSSAISQLRQKTRMIHAQSRADRLEQEKSKLLVQVSNLERSYADVQQQLEDEQESRNIMYSEYIELQKQFNHYKDSQKHLEDPEILRMALDQCRKDLSKAQQLVNEYKNEFYSVVPQSQFDDLERQLNQLYDENEKLRRDNSYLRQENRDIVGSIQELNNEVEQLKILKESKSKEGQEKSEESSPTKS